MWSHLQSGFASRALRWPLNQHKLLAGDGGHGLRRAADFSEFHGSDSSGELGVNAPLFPLLWSGKSARNTTGGHLKVELLGVPGENPHTERIKPCFPLLRHAEWKQLVNNLTFHASAEWLTYNYTSRASSGKKCTYYADLFFFAFKI